jgi:hypothetical protein
MTTKTLDERIREQARVKLREQIAAEFRPVFNRLGEVPDRYATLDMPTMPVGTKVRVNLFAHIEQIRDIIIGTLIPAAEEAAVAAFVQKVESLQEQIDSLNIQQ